jgi:rod shape-determining protein MreD
MMLQLLPAMTLAIAALAAILPFGAGDTVRMCLSFVPVIVAQYWSVRRPRMVPLPLIFAIGLAIDILTHGPVGFWALMMLAAAGLARLEDAWTGTSTTAGRAAVFCIAMLVVAGLAWAVASIYTGAMIDGHPMLVAALVAIAAYPLFAIMLMPIDRLWATPRVHLFERGG